jgi:hypothetical protein
MTEQQLTDAEAVLAAVARGEYDDALGISTEHRALLDKVAQGGPLTDADLANLSRHGHHDLIVEAHIAGRFNLNHDQEN